jgi:DNA-binding CsgD family transcriptional regulator
MFDYETAVGKVYDCAANPELWVETLETIRAGLNAAYVMVGYADLTPTLMQHMPIFTFRNTDWDVNRLQQLQGLSHEVPGAAAFQDGVTDKAWTQMDHISREDFEQTRFCREWAGPQGLTDSLIVPYVARPKVFGLFSAALHRSQGDVFNDGHKAIAERLAPHFRRAVLINDIVDQGKLALRLYRNVLDQLSTAVFVLGPGRRVVVTNAAGDAMLSDDNFLKSAGALTAHRSAGLPGAFEDAVDRAAKGDTAVGITGIGVPLIGKDGERVAAYVLPISRSDARAVLGQGHCIVFVTRRGEQQPMIIEVLRTLFDFTVAEARVAMLLSKGESAQAIAESLGVSITTVRTHLKHAFEKSGSPDQTALIGLIHAVLPPVTLYKDQRHV